MREHAVPRFTGEVHRSLAVFTVLDLAVVPLREVGRGAEYPIVLAVLQTIPTAAVDGALRVEPVQRGGKKGTARRPARAGPYT